MLGSSPPIFFPGFFLYHSLTTKVFLHNIFLNIKSMNKKTTLKTNQGKDKSTHLNTKYQHYV